MMLNFWEKRGLLVMLITQLVDDLAKKTRKWNNRSSRSVLVFCEKDSTTK